ncbi:hypothetical protein EON65_43230 [archaeon]|nr:MAG: hypothetical protein EON65_43230 [archaeon]
MLDYNSRLKPNHSKGLCGDEEVVESNSELARKCRQLASLLRASQYCVVFTGAGISTSAGIADFRGPRGVWTRELLGDPLKPEEKTAEVFNRAQPTYTHYAIKALIDQGYVKHLVSQNVDGLHLRSGVKAEDLSELHGNIFLEYCEKCNASYLHDTDRGGMGLKYTGNICTMGRCRGKLRDFAVDWDTDLPEEIFKQAKNEICKADLVIVLGSSLRIQPAGNMPAGVLTTTRRRPHKGKLVIVNLQKTHLDRRSELRIHHYTDEVMMRVCRELEINVAMSHTEESTGSSVV